MYEKYEYIKKLINIKSFSLYENKNIINYLVNEFKINKYAMQIGV